jgi:hypothetical protein
VADPENWLISDGKLCNFGKAPGQPDLFEKYLSGNATMANENRPLEITIDQGLAIIRARCKGYAAAD